MKKRKITAIILASLMGISAVPATAWAADSYKETEKAAFAKAIQEMGADYAQDLRWRSERKCRDQAQSG